MVLTIEERITSVDWHKYKGTEYFNADDVAPALIELVQLTDAQKTDDIYSHVLFAIGNNHAGTYYSVIEAALPFIIETAIQTNNETSQFCALEILTDVYCSFYPEISENERVDADVLRNNVNQSIEDIYDVLKKLALSEMIGHKNKQSIRYLIEIMDE